MTPDLAKITQPQQQALAAMYRGSASPAQQKMAWALISHLCGTEVPPEPQSTDRAFDDGRRWVGMVMARLSSVAIFGIPPGEKPDAMTGETVA